MAQLIEKVKATENKWCIDMTTSSFSLSHINHVLSPAFILAWESVFCKVKMVEMMDLRFDKADAGRDG